MTKNNFLPYFSSSFYHRWWKTWHNSVFHRRLRTDDKKQSYAMFFIINVCVSNSYLIFILSTISFFKILLYLWWLSNSIGPNPIFHHFLTTNNEKYGWTLFFIIALRPMIKNRAEPYFSSSTCDQWWKIELNPIFHHRLATNDEK